ncbi:MAG: uroporphyrinogen-III C-methyltransferase, partial [Cyanobacteria bacterium J083]
MSKTRGKVYLIGAGIGKLEYLTIAAQKILKRAEIVIYDNLVSAELLSLTPATCLCLEVGKRGGKPSTPQSQINQLLVSYYWQGKIVVRLKSGDPLIFGRAKEEISALKAADCRWEIIPGVSSALVAPLLAGIPLTDKNFSSCFTVLSGHAVEILNWQALAAIDTLIILMGGKNLAQITQNLIKAGKSPTEPIAIMRDVGSNKQKIWQGTLSDIVAKTQGIYLSPTIIVVGQVVRLKNIFNYSAINMLPLSNKTILVTRAATQSSKFTNLLEKQGANVLEMPALAITPPSSWQDLDWAIASIADFTWLILTSANGVEYFMERLFKQGKDLRALSKIKIAVVGKKTAQILGKYHLVPDFIPPNFVADSLVANFPVPLKGQKILFPRVETGGREVLIEQLSSQGAEILAVAAYQSQCPPKIDISIWNALKKQSIDIVTFASSKTVQNFCRLVNDALITQPDVCGPIEAIRIFCIIFSKVIS